MPSIRISKTCFPLRSLDTIAAFFLLLMALIMGSRSFVVGYIVSYCFFLAVHYKFKLTSFQKLLIVFLLLAGIASIAVFFKADSSAGRLLVYKVSFNILKANWLSGIGWGNFPRQYLKYQAEYFQYKHYSLKELLLADNTQHAFNDYLEFIIETGLIGFLLLILLSVIIWKFTVQSISLSKNFIGHIALIQLIAMLNAAFFTHVFEKSIFQLITIVCISAIGISTYRMSSRYYISCYLFLTLLILVIHFNYRLIHHRAYEEYKEARVWYKSGYILKAYKAYQQLLPQLKDDDSFLRDFSICLATLGDYNNAIKVLQKAISIKYTSYDYQRLGNYYNKIHRIGAAETAYLTAVYMVPNRFTSRYELFQFYRENNQIVKSIQAGRAILRLPVKIPSPMVDFIKSDVAKCWDYNIY